MLYARIFIYVLLAPIPSIAAEIAWVKSFDVALKQAAEQRKFVVLDMSASWCGFCRRMAREVYPDAKFVEFSRGLVFVRLFIDMDPQGPNLDERFAPRGFPTIVILNSRGQEVGRLIGARDRDRLIQEIEAITSRAQAGVP